MLRIDNPTAADPGESDTAERRRIGRIFAGWCFRQEATGKSAYYVLLGTLIFAAWWTIGAVMWRRGRPTGFYFQQKLLDVAAVLVVINGCRYASKAVCMAASHEFRDLVRLTGIHPLTLLGWQSAARWWTVFLSILILLPLAALCRTLGGTSNVLWVIGICWLFSLAMMTAGFAAMGSVSSTRSNNAESNAANASWALIALYHLLFWGLGMATHACSTYARGQFTLSFPAPEDQIADFLFRLAPATACYRALNQPDLVSLLMPEYWLHFLTGSFSFYFAALVLRNRFRVTTIPDDSAAAADVDRATTPAPTLQRPRCSDQPFLWKDIYILAPPPQNKVALVLFDIIGLVGVIVAAVYGFSLAAAVIAMLICPLVVMQVYSESLAAEIRLQTWSSLMLLPIDPRVILLAKTEAAIRHSKRLIAITAIATLIAAIQYPLLMLISVILAGLGGVLVIELTTIVQLAPKSIWRRIILGGAFGGIPLWIVVIAAIWRALGGTGTFFVAVGILLVLIVICHADIVRRLGNSSEPGV